MADKGLFAVKIQRFIKLTTEDIDDIMSAALDGGITDWCDEAEVVGEYLGEYSSEQISRGGSLKLHDLEEDKTYILTVQKFLKGFKQWFEESCDRYNAVQKDGTVDTSNIDGDMADAIIQYAVLGEWMY